MSTGRCGSALASGAALDGVCDELSDVLDMALVPRRSIHQILEHAVVAINGVMR